MRQRLGLPAWQPGNGQEDRRIDYGRVYTPEPRWTEDDIKRINAARSIWREAEDPRGTLADIYLKQHRKIHLADEIANSVLRFTASCPWRDEDTTIKVPALIAVFRQIGNNAITAVQRIRLDGDGRKIDRRMLGVVNGAAIKLAMPDNGTLAIGEGVETCLAAMQLDSGQHGRWEAAAASLTFRLSIT